MILYTLPYMGKPIESFDLVDEMEFEDNDELFITLEAAGLEDNPVFDTVPFAQREYYNES